MGNTLTSTLLTCSLLLLPITHTLIRAFIYGGSGVQPLESLFLRYFLCFDFFIFFECFFLSFFFPPERLLLELLFRCFLLFLRWRSDDYLLTDRYDSFSNSHPEYLDFDGSYERNDQAYHIRNMPNF